MEKLVVYNREYNNIFKNDDTIIKYSNLPCDYWVYLERKKLDYINTPIDIIELTSEEQTKYKGYKSKVVLPYLKGYDSFEHESFTKNYKTIDILRLLKYNLELLKNMHSHSIVHGDLYPSNIMINKDLNFKFIDFDASIIDGFISTENTYFDTPISDRNKKSLTIIQDKVDILDLYMHYLTNATFDKIPSIPTDISSLKLPKDIENKINGYLSLELKPKSNDYFIDIVDDLIENKYESQILEKRR